MRLSNKSTFSLASLIVLIALGLVFVGTSVMAHDGSHPVNEAILGDDPATPNTVETDEVITAAHNGHPVPTISLKDEDPNSNTDGVNGAEKKVVIAANDSTTDPVREDQFTLVVEFDQDVVGTAIEPTVTADFTDADNLPTSILADDELTDIVLNSLGAEIDSGIRIESVTWVEKRKFEVLVTVQTDAIPNGTADDPLEEVTVRARVNAGAVFSLQTVPVFDDVPGGPSVASSLLEFTLVSSLPDDPPPTDAVVSTVVAGGLSADDEVVFTITFDKVLNTSKTPPQTFRLGDVTVEGGSAVDFVADADGKTFMVTVEADDATQPITVTAGGISAVSDPEQVVVTPETPVVGVINLKVIPPAAPNADGNLVFKITSNEELTRQLSVGDIDINTQDAEPLASGDLVKDATAASGIAESYTLTVTPKSGVTSVLVEVRAGATTAKNDETKVTPGAEGRYSPETGKPSIAFCGGKS